MELLCVRVDHVHDDTKTVFQSWLRQNSTKYLVYEELGATTQKLHYQGVVQLDLSVKNLHAWSKNIKDMIKVTGKNQYSLTKMKSSKYLIYITKDKKKVCSDGFTDEEIGDLESQSYSKETKGGSKETYAERLYEQCKSLISYDIRPDGSKELLPINRSKLVTMVVTQFCKDTKVFDRGVLTRFCMLIENKLMLEYGNQVSQDLVRSIVDSMTYKTPY